MELTPGFKPSEAGPIPEDWESVRLGDSRPFVTSGSRGWSRYYAETGDLFVRITNMFRDEVRLDLSNVRFVQPPPESSEVARTALQLNDLLISITADIGIVSLVTPDVPLPAFVNQHVAAVRLAPETIVPLYAAYALKSGHSSAWFRAITDAGAKAGINLSTVRETPIVVPPLPEQRAIAGVLGEVDAWIAAAEAEAAKLAAVKAAAMDALLTPTTRLPGFAEEWALRPLGDILTVRHGRSQHEVAQKGGPFPIMATGGEIGRASAFLHPGPAVMIGRKGTIDSPQFYAGPFWSIDTLFYCPAKKDNNALFAYYLFHMIDWPRYNEASGVPSLNSATIEQIELPIPEPAEQRAIAAVLTDLDAALAAARAVVAKARGVKAAATDALLSGRVRLPLA